MEIQTYRERVEQEFARMRAKGRDSYRPVYHLTPLAGTLADPNGLCRIGDTYHIYYVTNPLNCVTKERTACVWGHYSTKDFVHYRREPVAVWPDDRRDQDGVYSGSALVRDGKIYFYYTGNVRHAGDYDYVLEGREQNVLRVDSADAVHFQNKMLLMTNEDFPSDMTRHVRDPQMVEKNGEVYMLLGARTKEDRGCVLVYRSSDLVHFEQVNLLDTKDAFGYMWECPDLAELDGQSFLLACPQGIPHETYRFQNSHQCGYFPLRGDFAGAYELGDFEQFDYGFDFYAARTLKEAEGRTLLIGWLGMSEAEYGKTPSAARGWDQAIAMPRELTLRDGRLYQRPLEELNALRKNHTEQDGTGTFQIQSDCFELRLCLERQQNLCVRLREDCVLAYDAARQELTLSLGETCGQGRDRRSMRLEKLEELRVFMDATIVEIFINGGYAVMTSRIFGESRELLVEAFEGKLDFYEMRGFEIEELEEQHEYSF